MERSRTSLLAPLLVMLALAVAACCVALVPCSAFAAVPTKVLGNGVDLVAHPGQPGDPLYYDGAGTLCLTGATIDRTTSVTTPDGDEVACALYADDDLNVVLAGASTLAFHDSQDSPDDPTPGLYVQGAATLSGGGSLRADNGYRVFKGIVASRGIEASGVMLVLDCVANCLVVDDEGGDVVLSGCTVALDCSYEAKDSPFGANAILVTEGTCNVDGCDLAVVAIGRLGNAMRANEGRALSSSRVEAQGQVGALYSESPVRLADVTGSLSGLVQGGIYAAQDLSFTGACALEVSNLLEGPGETSAAIQAARHLSFDLAPGGFVTARGSAEGYTNDFEHVPAIMSYGLDGPSFTLAASNVVTEPAGGKVVSATFDPFEAFFTTAADGSFARTVTIAYRAKPVPTPVDYAVPAVRKALAGDEPAATPVFTFALEAAASGQPLPDTIRASVRGAGVASFGTITFAQAGVYRYTIAEVQDAQRGWTYSTAVYELSVTVEETDEGPLRAVGALTLRGQPVSEPLFQNAYRKPGVLADTGDPLAGASVGAAAAAAAIAFAASRIAEKGAERR